MGRIKLTAKSHLLGNTLTVFLVFTVFVSAVVLSGNFSFMASYLFRIPLLKEFASTDFAYRMLKITLSVAGIVLSALTVPDLTLGVERWFMLKAKGEVAQVKDIFYFFRFSHFLRAQAAFWYSFFIRSGVFVFFQFPALCMSGIIYNAVKYGEIAYAILVSLLLTDVLLFLTGMVFYFVYSANWLIYSFIVVSDDTVSPDKAYALSAEFAEKSVGRLCLFRLSFVPWWLLSVFVFPLFYVWGYYKQSLAVLAFEQGTAENDEF